MHWITKLNTPWVHFLILGVVFYQVQSVLFPEPKPVIGPLSEARIAALQQQWKSGSGQEPSIQQLAQLVDVELDRDMLFQHALELNIHLYDGVIRQRLIRNMHFLQMAENKSADTLFEQALEMRLHLDDTIVKRRLIQLVEQQILANNPPLQPSPKELEAEYQRRFDQLRKPALLSFKHLFFNAEREFEAARIIAQIDQQNLDYHAARQMGSPYLQGHSFASQSSDQLTQVFGKSFASDLEQEVNKQQWTTQQWYGPIRSAYGQHYVWLTEYQPERDALLNEVKEQLRNDLEYTARTAALQAGITKLRKNYELIGLEVVEVGGTSMEARK
ncbi:MAG: peptidylprolyl isomerase [Pseudomonadota bacterium]